MNTREMRQFKRKTILIFKSIRYEAKRTKILRVYSDRAKLFVHKRSTKNKIAVVLRYFLRII